MTLMTSILIVKELKVIVKYSLAYMFNLKTDFFDKNIERPRLFTYIVFGALSVFIIIQYHHLSKDLSITRYFSTLFFQIFLVCNFFLLFTWLENFKKTFIPKAQKKKLARNAKLYEIKWTREQLKLIYENLNDKNLIELINEDSDEIDYRLFINILNNGTIPETPAFKLNMNNIKTKYFFDQLKYNSDDFTLDMFLEIFDNINKKSTRNSIEVSYTNARIKIDKKIESIFQKVKTKKD
ncbi:hypothetical protein [Leeuwenhoekiella aequorea]|nr:hypothetical protein [Leeuwenhoekiella aequorea]